MMPSRLFAAVFAGLLCASALAQTSVPPLVVISVDGMKPESVTEADRHKLKIPVLREFLVRGSYADGVVGVVPSITYPSHTTMVTGVWPAEHGVVGNFTFDPLREHPGVWYWDFSAIKVPTLYTVARAAGITTANVSWPVTIGAPFDYNIAEDMDSEIGPKAAGSLLNPLDILEQIGVHPDENVDEDVLKTAEAVGVLKTFHPGLLLVHLTDLDHREHEHGPFSVQANRALETIDTQVGEIERAALAADPRTRIAVVSDHGFQRVDRMVNLNAILARAGLMELSPVKPGGGARTVVRWQAESWGAGGSAAIMLQRSEVAELLAKVRGVLEKARADPRYGIETILDHEELVRRGGFPEASFFVDFKDGFEPGDGFSGAVVEAVPATGAHGYLPSRVAMQAAFLIRGDGIAEGRDVGVIDMRQIAPTLAGLLHVRLPDAKLEAVPVLQAAP